MAATQPDIQIDTEETSDETSIQLTDATGIYNGTTNLTGYGLPGGPTVNDVDNVVLRVTMNYLGAAYFEFDFTVTSGVITAATLSLDGAAAVNILASLVSTVWPFASPFDLMADYGVTLPTKSDDVYKIDYTIAGTTAIGANVFSFLTTEYLPIKTDKQCIIDQKFADLELDAIDLCPQTLAERGETLIKIFENAGRYGKMTPALAALTELDRICTDDCGC